MKKILITGGAGFIGSNLTKKLLERGYEVTVLDNLSEQIHGSNPTKNSKLYLSIKDKVNFIKGSVNNRSILKKAIKNNDFIIHLAAETGTGQSMYQIEKYSKVNIQGMALLLDILSNNNHKVKKIIVSSSRAVYGEGKYYSKDLGSAVYPDQRNKIDMQNGDFDVKYKGFSNLQLLPTDEESMLNPTSFYGISKLFQEQMMIKVCKSIGVASVALRYQNVFGPGQSLSNPYTGILSIFSTQIKNGNSINIFEDGLESRDFVYIDDVINATILALESNNANNEIFNVGSGVATSVKEVAETLIKCYNSRTKMFITGQFRLGDIRHNVADLTKIKQKLGFEPIYTFEKGISNFVSWVEKQEIYQDNFEQSINELKKEKAIRMKKLGLVTVLYKSNEVLEPFLKSIDAQSFKDFNLYLIDNSVDDFSTNLLKILLQKFNLENKSIHIKCENNVGIARGNNIGISKALSDECENILLLNNDIEFYQEDIFDKMLDKINDNLIISPKIFYFDDKNIIWYAGSKISAITGLAKMEGNGKKDGIKYMSEKKVSYGPTCFMLFNRKIFDEVGLMDEKYFVYFDDSDFLMRCNRNGYNILLMPQLHIYHKIANSSGGQGSPFYIELVSRNRFYFIFKNFKNLSFISVLFFGVAITLFRFITLKGPQRAALIRGTQKGIKLVQELINN